LAFRFITKRARSSERCERRRMVSEKPK